MARLYDTVSKKVVLSDGDDHQLQGELSRQLLTTKNSGIFFTDTGCSEHESMHYPDQTSTGEY